MSRLWSGGPPRDLGPGDLGVLEMAQREREQDDEDEQEHDDGGSAELWAEPIEEDFFT